MRACLILATTALLAVNTAHAADVYRWVDKDGSVHYSDAPPPSSAKESELRRLGTNAIDVDKLPYATRDAAKKNPVTLYASNCGNLCDGARQLLAKRGIPFTSKNPEATPADAETLKKLIGVLEVPVLVVGNGTPLKGFEAGAWNSALDNAGYATSGVVKASPTETNAKPASPTPPPATQPPTEEQKKPKY